jgi:flagellar basal body-associated protein FliL
MDDTWFKVLVIIMSVLLIVLLTVMTATAILLYKMTQEAKRLVSQTTNIAENAEKFVAGFAKSSTPLAILKFLYSIKKDAKKGK